MNRALLSLMIGTMVVVFLGLGAVVLQRILSPQKNATPQ